MQVTFMIKDLPQIADQILLSAPFKTILFYGEMGVGKTTLIKELAKKIGVTDTLSSPTFSIVNEYKTQTDKLFHFDCYRITSEEEALDFGIEEYLDSDNWNLIEWPEKIANLLPEKSTKIQLIKNTNGSRTVKLEPMK
ncbi:tRNA (adenosine(37)-N6)-threonylcarbamoyltransferase complex ATPase subunit type 1 TsaE [Ulvibacter litoralis]|uniref:tRNA threonylcarbamoyladenosine biosynthesis protein TsaE n=1 Tax=Ulvibacter litoralis TaxID=227084 RepID=A0A1G7FBM2_9FLAO|nr:tRNA (adenosine(37)-N6)-threonylcarbamoyltransferase complex ATPase subunit type 1 TsaE [Ulvibacter litoralis]GHC51850.1 tRNA (adenosine(37)-N6)-threonylcarbamoyltransferase complex ATPase subunit type 1 TsaE [Ulvibacter litoralis]SDE73340.1 tRNA threonylcarbamoyladenosine biosynthesis protein TsaE [Ulvibacter litoralis]